MNDAVGQAARRIYDDRFDQGQLTELPMRGPATNNLDTLVRAVGLNAA
jgi:hypothetical protein